jgi:hypothetical protein
MILFQVCEKVTSYIHFIHNMYWTCVKKTGNCYEDVPKGNEMLHTNKYGMFYVLEQHELNFKYLTRFKKVT